MLFRRATVLWMILGIGGMASFNPECRAEDLLIPKEKHLSNAWVRSLTARGERRPYRGDELQTIGMPCGGIGAGQLYVRGDGTLAQWWIANNAYGTAWWWDPLQPEVRRDVCCETPLGCYPAAYRTYQPPGYIEQGFAIRVETDRRAPRVCPLSLRGFDDPLFFGEYPIARVEYRSPKGGPLPVVVSAEVFSPFIPLDARDSATPATILRYHVKNSSAKPVDVRVVGWLQNPVALGLKGRTSGLSRNIVVRHSGLTSIAMDLAPRPDEPAGPPSFRSFENFESGSYGLWTTEGTAFGTAPAGGTFPGQQTVSGFEGRGLANSFTGGDQATGRLISPGFTIHERGMTFLIGGGPYEQKTCLNLVVDGKVARTAFGHRNAAMVREWWDVSDLSGRRARLEIVDASSGAWGHILVDDIAFVDRLPPEVFPREDPQFGDMALSVLGPQASAGADCGPIEGLLEGLAAGEDPAGSGEASAPLGTKLCGALGTSFRLEPAETKSADFILTWYFPNRTYDSGGSNNMGRMVGGGPRVGQMYANWFNSSLDVARRVASDFERLDRETHLFRDTYFDTTLPYWFVQRIGMPVANLATETCQWWANGRFYGWEGVGCCEGTCTHVWHYEQAVGRLFPQLARSIREMQNLNPDTGFDIRDGGINDRGKIPGIVAIDGQCGVILACLRETQMSADDGFLRRNWPRIKQAIEYLIAQDGNGDGLIENEQPNTYDISFYGANTFSGSLYLASLRAGEEMARRMDDEAFAGKCRAIFLSGRALTMKTLWNGEYFIQRVDSKLYPQYQYGTGCLSDQVIGQAWAHQLGLGYLYPPGSVKSALKSVWANNWAPDVGRYNAVHKPEIIFADPGEGGLFLCTWPEKGHPGANGVRYHDTVWSGIEGEVSAHMIAEGMLTEGLAILRGVHDRYDGRKHNPWNQILCGDHYARAMSSWGCLISAGGFSYDGPNGRFGFAPRIGPEDFKSFFSAAEGWGSLVQKRGKGLQSDFVEVKWGHLRMEALELQLPGGAKLKRAVLNASGWPVECRFEQSGSRVTLRPAAAIVIQAGGTLRADLTW
jgi:non-lysosomal glucosylceramidase